MILYRIENEQGVGPLSSGLALIHKMAGFAAVLSGKEALVHELEHIGSRAARDGLQFRSRPPQVYACQPLDTLRKWFPSRAGCEAMAAAGGLLVTYSTPRSFRRDSTLGSGI